MPAHVPQSQEPCEIHFLQKLFRGRNNEVVDSKGLFHVTKVFETFIRPVICIVGYDVAPFFRSESYESRLAASVSWQEDCEPHDERGETAFTGVNRSDNPTG
jgi:hypothetical protein